MAAIRKGSLSITKVTRGFLPFSSQPVKSSDVQRFHLPDKGLP